MTLRTTATTSIPGARAIAAAPLRHRPRALLLGALLAGLLFLAFRPAPTDAAVWIPESSGMTEDLYAVSCVSPTFCLAGGRSDKVTSFNGTRWNAALARTGFPGTFDLDCASPSFCKAVTVGGPMFSFDGSSWLDEGDLGIPPSPVYGVYGVACVPAGSCTAVGGDCAGCGLTWSWSGSAWSASVTVRDASLLRGIACASASFCKAVGDSGTIVSWDGRTWRADTSPTAQYLNGIACASASSCKAVGQRGTVLSFDGTAWRADVSGTREDLRRVSCSSASLCKAVGGHGTILSWDGTAWRLDSSGTRQTLADVSCVSPDFCKVVGENGLLLTLAPASRASTQEVPVSVACNGAGQICDNRFELPLGSPAGALRVRFVADAAGCSDVRVTLLVYDRIVAPLVPPQDRPLVSTTSDFLEPGESGEELTLDYLPPNPLAIGRFLRVTAEGRDAGCNTGTLGGFRGTLLVIRG